MAPMPHGAISGFAITISRIITAQNMPPVSFLPQLVFFSSIICPFLNFLLDFHVKIGYFEIMSDFPKTCSKKWFFFVLTIITILVLLTFLVLLTGDKAEDIICLVASWGFFFALGFTSRISKK